MAEFTKRVSDRVKTFKCNQNKCRSDNEDNMEVVVFGGNQKAPVNGFVCSSCFLSNPDTIREFKEGRTSAIPITKFIKNLNEFYEKYRNHKSSPQWQPTINQAKGNEIKSLIVNIDNQISRKINQILNGVYKEAESAIAQLKTNNNDNDFDMMIQFLKQEKTIDISSTLLNLSERIVKLQDEYSYSGQQHVRQGNERIIARIGSIIKLAEDAIGKLIELHKKQIQFILQ